jgi:hypothetical protein
MSLKEPALGCIHTCARFCEMSPVFVYEGNVRASKAGEGRKMLKAQGRKNGLRYVGKRVEVGK